MPKIVTAGSTQTKTAPAKPAPKSQAATANPKNAESRSNLSKVFGVPKK